MRFIFIFARCSENCFVNVVIVEPTLLNENEMWMLNIQDYWRLESSEMKYLKVSPLDGGCL